MPIQIPSQSTAPVFYPKKDYSIGKYIDFIKFMSLLKEQSLFFCRLDKLQDHFEGTVPKLNFQYRVKWLQELRKSGFLKVPMTDEQIIKEVLNQYEFDKKLKSLYCVNCWNKFETESAALWKIYSDFNNGLMLKSSIFKLRKSMQISDEEVMLSEIMYKDYNKEIIPDGNSNYPIIHKHIGYSYENEVRLIHRKMPSEGWVFDWDKEDVKEGLYIKVSIDELIDEIIISPYSPQWFFKLIQDVSKKYGLNKPINKSELSIE